MASGFRIATAFVQVSPDTSGFREELQSKLDEAVAGVEGRVKVSLDTADLDAKFADVRARLDELGAMVAQPSVHLDDAALTAKIDEISAKLDELGSRDATARASLDDADLTARADESGARLDALAGRNAAARLSLDTAEFDAALAEARARLDAFSAQSATVRLGASGGGGGVSSGSGGGGGVVSYNRDSRGRFTGGSSVAQPAAAPTVSGSATAAAANLDQLGGHTVTAHLSLSTAEFDAKLEEARARLAAFGSQSASPRLGASGGGGGGHGGGGGEGGMLGGIAMGIGALLPGVGGALAGLGGAAGVGALALAPIAKVLSAKYQATQTPGLTSQQTAQMNFSNQVGTFQAQQQVTQAKLQQGQDSYTSSQSIQMAQMNLATTTRNSAMQQVQALQSVTQAEQGVQQSSYNLSQAQYNLNQAWVQAQQNLRAVNDQLANSKLNVQQANLAIQQAQWNKLLVDQNVYSTSIDRAGAVLAVAQAQQQLKNAQDAQIASQYQANLVNSQGVAGQQTVIQAKQALVQANYGTVNSSAQANIAQMNLTNTQLNNATAIKQATMQLAMTQRQAAYQQMMDARSVSLAQINLTNTIKGQQLQWAATVSTANQAANQYQLLFGKLTPAAQQAVTQILGMRDAFKQVQATAQNAILPGLGVILTGVQQMTPSIQQAVGKIGQSIGDGLANIGKQMQGAGFQTVFQGLIDNGIRFGQIVMPAIGGFVKALAGIGAQKGASDGVANLIAGIMKGFTGLAQVVGQNQGPINAFLTAVGNIVTQIGPLLGQVIGLVARAFGPLASYLNSHPNGTLTKTIAGIATAMLVFPALVKAVKMPFEAIKTAAEGIKTVTGITGKVASGIGRAFGPGGVWDSVRLRGMYAADGIRSAWSGLSSFASTAVSTVGGWARSVGSAAAGAAQSVGSFVATFGQRLMQAAAATGSWIVRNTVATVAYIAQNVARAASATAAFIAENAATLGIIAGIALLVAGILYLATHWQQVWHAIEVGALWLWHNVLDPMWHGIVAGAQWLYNVGIKPLWSGIQSAFGLIESGAMWLWHHVFDPMWHGIQIGAAAFVLAFKTTWNQLQGIFKTPINFLIGAVYTHGIEALWNGVVGAIGQGSLKLPDIPQLAGGGVIPGYAPGRDTVHAMLSPGEGVLVPEAVQAIGPGTVNNLNATYGRGRKSSPGHFSGGGIAGAVTGALSSAGNFLSGAAGTAVDVAKIVAAVTTGNTTALTNAMTALVGTNAAGNYAKMLLGVPKTLIGDAVKALTSAFATSSAAGSGGVSTPVAVSGSVASWFQQAIQATGVPMSWLGGLETIAKYESGFNPNAINNWDSNAKNGDPSRGLMQTIMATFNAYHQSGTSNNIYDPVANIAAGINYIKGRYGTVGNVPGIKSLAQGGPYVGYDSGGWLMPGNMPVNGLAKPEAVLTPAQSQAFVQMAGHLGSRGGGQAAGKQVVINFNGTTYPNAEQMAAIQRQMTLALSGAS